jgi:hypothetical protein
MKFTIQSRQISGGREYRKIQKIIQVKWNSLTLSMNEMVHAKTTTTEEMKKEKKKISTKTIIIIKKRDGTGEVN